jgi:beta-mannosidase
VRVHATQELNQGWTVAAAPAGSELGPADLDGLQWVPATVPGTVAGALRDAGLWRLGDSRQLDACDWWFRTSFAAEPAGEGEELVLSLEGVATVFEVYLNGELLLAGESMFAAHSIDVGRRLAPTGAPAPTSELAICCRALSPLLAQRRRPRARWRTRVVSDGSLRFFRTMLLGRTPGIAPAAAAIGPWRAVRLVRRRTLVLEQLSLRPRLEGSEGMLAITARVRPLGDVRLEGARVKLDGPSGSHDAQLTLAPAPDSGGAARELIATGELSVPDVARWWPHTHGEPALHHVELVVAAGGESVSIDAGSVGFRELSVTAQRAGDPQTDGLALSVNGVPVFARGAIWTPADLVGMAPATEQLRARLQRACEAGMNMLRIAGTSAYETARFHDLCDELGIMLWQDFMFANLDYPISDEAFRELVIDEAHALLEELAGRPSLTVLCGNSEVEQQVGMLGLDPELGRGELFGSLLPALVEQSGVDAAYLPSAPCGTGLPFRANSGVANYFGVGAYLRGLEDVRRSEVRFASECLAFSNVPDEDALADLNDAAHDAAQGAAAVHGAAWKDGVPRDSGAGWDFEDVRDHYLELLHRLDSRELRSVDPERYLELSRAVTGELMAEVFGEWRRAASPCGGGLVLWLADLAPGAGWGVLDHRGAPKAAYHRLARALAPVAVWTIDEGLGGVVAHVANDLPQPLAAQLRIALYSGGERLVGEASVPVALAAHSQAEWNLETVLGRFVDISWAYRFGAPAQDAIVVSLHGHQGQDGLGEQLSQSVRFPAGPGPMEREPIERIGLSATLAPREDGSAVLELSSARLAHGVRVHARGYTAREECFTLEPSVARRVQLLPCAGERSLEDVRVSALNMHGRARAALQP